jgi:hypothetical protein
MFDHFLSSQVEGWKMPCHAGQIHRTVVRIKPINYCRGLLIIYNQGDALVKLLHNRAAILTEPYSASKGSIPIPIPTPTPMSRQIGIGIGIEKSACRTTCIAKYFISRVEKHGLIAMNDIRLESLTTGQQVARAGRVLIAIFKRRCPSRQTAQAAKQYDWLP